MRDHCDDCTSRLLALPLTSLARAARAVVLARSVLACTVHFALVSEDQFACMVACLIALA